jgi:hypothetical protein
MDESKLLANPFLVRDASMLRERLLAHAGPAVDDNENTVPDERHLQQFKYQRNLCNSIP